MGWAKWALVVCGLWGFQLRTTIPALLSGFHGAGERNRGYALPMKTNTSPKQWCTYIRSSHLFFSPSVSHMMELVHIWLISACRSDTLLPARSPSLSKEYTDLERLCLLVLLLLLSLVMLFILQKLVATPTITLLWFLQTHYIMLHP